MPLFLIFGTVANASTPTPDDQFLFERHLTKLIRLGHGALRERETNPSSADNMAQQYSTDYSTLFRPRRVDNWSCMVNIVIDFATTTDVRFQKFASDQLGILCTHTSEGASTTKYILVFPKTDRYISVFRKITFPQNIQFSGDFIDETERQNLTNWNNWPPETPTEAFAYIVIQADALR